MKLIRKDKKKGFTLIELIVVIAILAILALILVPSITGYVAKANEARDQANARSIYTAVMLVDSTTENAFNGTTLSDAAMAQVKTISNITDTIVVSKDASGIISVTYGNQTFNGSTFTTK